MARPTTITHEQILAAAREVFLEKGIRATTADVAKRANVAAGSIFNRFKTKEDLFFEAMHPTVDAPVWLTTLLQRAGQGDLRENLADLGAQIINHFRTILPLMMMAWSNAGACGEIPGQLRDARSPPLVALEAMTSFFAAEMRAGRLRGADPEILARVFLGAIANYALFEVILHARNRVPMPIEQFLDGLVDLMWRGAGPTKRPTPKQGPQKDPPPAKMKPSRRAPKK